MIQGVSCDVSSGITVGVVLLFRCVCVEGV